MGVTPLVQVGVVLPRRVGRSGGPCTPGKVWAAVALHPNEGPRVVHGDGAEA